MISRTSAHTPPPREAGGGNVVVPHPPARPGATAPSHHHPPPPPPQASQQQQRRHSTAPGTAQLAIPERNTAAAPTTAMWRNFFAMSSTWRHIRVPCPRSHREATKALELLAAPPGEPVVFILEPRLLNADGTAATPVAHEGWSQLPHPITVGHSTPVVIQRQQGSEFLIALASRDGGDAPRQQMTVDKRPVISIDAPARVVIEGLRLGGAIHVADGARAAIERCTVDLPSPVGAMALRGPRRDFACLRASGSVSVRESRFTGGSVGVALCANRVLPVLVSYCSISDQATVGVWADGPSPPRVENTTIERCGTVGVVIGGAALGGSVTECTIQDCLKYGIVIEANAGAWAQRNAIRRCNDAAIVVLGNSHPVLLSNTIDVTERAGSGDDDVAARHGHHHRSRAQLATAENDTDAAVPQRALALLFRQQSSCKAQSNSIIVPVPSTAPGATVASLPPVVALDTADVVLENNVIYWSSAKGDDEAAAAVNNASPPLPPLIFASGNATVDCTANAISQPEHHQSAAEEKDLESAVWTIGLHTEWASIRHRATRDGSRIGTTGATAGAGSGGGLNPEVGLCGDDTLAAWTALLPPAWTQLSTLRAKPTPDDAEPTKPSLAMAAFSLLAAAHAAAGEEQQREGGDALPRPASELDDGAHHQGVRLSTAAAFDDPRLGAAAGGARTSMDDDRGASSTPHARSTSCPPISAAAVSPRRGSRVADVAKRLVHSAELKEREDEEKRRGRSPRGRPVTPREEELLQQIARLNAQMAQLRSTSPRAPPPPSSSASARGRSTSGHDKRPQPPPFSCRPQSATSTGAAAAPAAFEPFAPGCTLIRVGRYKWDAQARREFLAGRLPLSAARYEVVRENAVPLTRPASRARSAAATPADEAVANRLYDSVLQHRADSRAEAEELDSARQRLRRGIQLTEVGQKALARRLHDKSMAAKRELAEQLKQRYLTKPLRPVGWIPTPGDDGEAPATADASHHPHGAATPSERPASSSRSPSRITYVRRLTTPASDEAERCARIADQLEDYRLASMEKRAKLEQTVLRLPWREKQRVVPRVALEAYCDSLYRSHRDPSLSPRLAAAGADVDIGFVARKARAAEAAREAVRASMRANRPPQRKRSPEAVAAYAASLHYSHKDSNLVAAAARLCPADPASARGRRPAPPPTRAPPKNVIVFVPEKLDDPSTTTAAAGAAADADDDVVAGGPGLRAESRMAASVDTAAPSESEQGAD